MGGMDLTKQAPRSPYETMAGIVSLPRVIDKARANAEGTLGEYDVDCPHDRPVLEFLGVDFATFSAKIKELNYDDAAIAAWAKERLAKRSPAEIDAFNEARRNWGPDEHSRPYFDKLHEQVAHDRPDVTTWFDLLDLDEGRSVAKKQTTPA
jgi:hypothetical protein